ncbi:MAG: DNA gyrase subunit A [bacterium]
MPRDVVLTPISGEMKKAYLDYAMSVIVSRALPDVRDGLKPVQRRIIYAMHEQGIKSNTRFSKCAAVVGETMKKYHPHGDMAIYDTLVRMAQEFSLRYPLIEAQGNFGSIDGDPPAAMRYTEARLSKVSDYILKDIGKETVDFAPAYIPSIIEPTLLPAVIPNLIINGVTGIAVGMATNIPSHNLAEVVDALIHMADNHNSNTTEIMKFIKGPDFPTKGIIYNKKDILDAYETGRGGITMRAKTDIEELKGGKEQIIITELPYQTNKANLVAKIAELAREEKVKGISDLRDESDRHGIRVVIELKRDAAAQRILNKLYKHTELQTNFNCNFVSLVHGTPQTLSLKEMLTEFLKHREIIITRRTQFLLKKAREREHILLGLKIAVDHIDEVIKIIRQSSSADTAKTALIKRFKLTDLQATAILDMQLRRLAALERKKIEEELAEIQASIKEYEAILADTKKVLAILKEELLEVKQKFGDKRLTKVIPGEVGTFSEEELVKEEDVFVATTESGYIKRMPVSTYKSQGRGGKGVRGGALREGDELSSLRITNTHNTMLFFTNKGNVFELRVWELPEGSRTSRGTAVVNLLNLRGGEEVVEILAIEKNEINGGFVFFTTRKGLVKKTPLANFENIRKTGIRAINLKEGDMLVDAKLTHGKDHIMLVTEGGKSIRFEESGVRSMGRTAAGVRGIRLSKEDGVIALAIIRQGDNKNRRLLILGEKGKGKTTKLSAYKLQGRGGGGILTYSVSTKTGKLVSARLIDKEVEEIVISSVGGHVIRLPAKTLPTLGRSTQGVILMRLPASDTVTSVALI